MHYQFQTFRTRFALLLLATLGLSACESGLPSGLSGLNSRPKAAEAKPAEDPNLRVYGSPATAWAGGNCYLGGLEVAAYDGVTGQRIDGVMARLSGSRFDGQIIPEQTVRLPMGYQSGEQLNSQPRSYQIELITPPGYAYAEPKKILVHFDCRNRLNRFAEFKIYRTAPGTPTGTPAGTPTGTPTGTQPKATPGASAPAQ